MDRFDIAAVVLFVFYAVGQIFLGVRRAYLEALTETEARVRPLMDAVDEKWPAVGYLDVPGLPPVIGRIQQELWTWERQRDGRWVRLPLRKSIVRALRRRQPSRG